MEVDTFQPNLAVANIEVESTNDVTLRTCRHLVPDWGRSDRQSRERRIADRRNRERIAIQRERPVGVIALLFGSHAVTSDALVKAKPVVLPAARPPATSIAS